MIVMNDVNIGMKTYKNSYSAPPHPYKIGFIALTFEFIQDHQRSTNKSLQF